MVGGSPVIIALSYVAAAVVTALAYVLTLEHPERFPKSCDLGPIWV
jgi:hypothetical protein